MATRSLEASLQEASSPTDFVRTIGPDTSSRHLRFFDDLPDEFTNWREEQRAWKESCALADLSHHMYDLHVEGPDAFDLFADLGANGFENVVPGKAKQFFACNPDGYLIGDGILFRLGENEFDLVGYAAINWVQYHLETGDYDARAERDGHSGVREGPPRTFRYQVQGPQALTVLREAADGPLPEVPFFNFGEVAFGGRTVNALRHGMMDEPGFEVFGDWDAAEAVREALLEAGRDHGMRRIGARAYPTNVIPTAWVALPLPAIFGESMAAYREWLPADSFEGAFTVGGSYNPDDVRDYYLDPVEVGYDRFIDFDHDFVGREALGERVADQHRRKVTLVWDGDDVTSVYGSLFRDGPTNKFVDLPIPNWAVSMYDRVAHDGETVGVSVAPRYLFFERTMFSLGIVDDGLSEPGTEVTLVWGEEGPTANPRVEEHDQVEVAATVAPAPFYEDKKKTTDYTAV